MMRLLITKVYVVVLYIPHAQQKNKHFYPQPNRMKNGQSEMKYYVLQTKNNFQCYLGRA